MRSLRTEMMTMRRCPSLLLLAVTPLLPAAVGAQPSGEPVSHQGQAAVASAAAMAATIRARVDAAARARSGANPGVVPRARAFYDVLRSEDISVARPPTPSSAAAEPEASIAATGARLLAEPGGTQFATSPPGTKVTILDQRPGWRKVLAEDGTVGWLRATELVYPHSEAASGPYVASSHNTISATISYPESAGTARAIRRMASGQVSAIPNRCAGSMAEALGWGLGDAHQWMGLEERGFVRRPAGKPPQPGDILVWPFTFGRSQRQHVGFAVAAEGQVKLLSNLTGRIQLTRVLPGYTAFAPPSPDR
jgi:hypothetical protein